MTDAEFEKELVPMRKRPEHEIIALSNLRDGSALKLAATKVLQERRDKEEERRHRELLGLKQEREQSHTLVTYWKLATWDERFGYAFVLLGVFLSGFGAAQIPYLSNLIKLLKNFKP